MVWLLFCFFSIQQAFAVRVKDLADIYGDRTNLVFGYGLVTGLKRTGDSNRNLATIKAMTKRLQGLGITLTPMELRSRNVASVMVTAEIPSGARAGQKVEVDV